MEENKILKLACTIPKHRIDRNKLHLSTDIVFITFAALISGANTGVTTTEIIFYISSKS